MDMYIEVFFLLLFSISNLFLFGMLLIEIMYFINTSQTTIIKCVGNLKPTN